VASIIESFGHGDFARVKIGVGRPPREWTAESYVLSRFGEQELELIEKELTGAAQAAEVFVTEGVTSAQARFNRKDLNE
jgi:PTH1 family peptidyl-tRNA hydrolase